MKITVGTRGSKLATTQTNLVLEELKELAGGAGIEIDIDVKKIKTTGDKIETSLSGGVGFFVKEVNEAVEDGRVDFAVHSMKDMPTEISPKLKLIAAKRVSPYDALISRYKSIDDLPHNARIGTSSFRRRAELKRLRSDLDICDLRGNLDTRLKRFDGGDFDAIVVAEAGLIRLGMAERVKKRLSMDEIMPPAGQGALGIMARKNDRKILEIISLIEDKKTMIEVSAEREFLDSLHGGCQIPAGVLARVSGAGNEGGEIKISAMVSSLDGKKSLRANLEGSVNEGNELGARLAEMLLNSGGREILEDIRGVELCNQGGL